MTEISVENLKNVFLRFSVKVGEKQRIQFSIFILHNYAESQFTVLT